MDHSTGASLGKVSFLVLWHIWTNLAANIAVNRWNVDHLLCCVRPLSASWPQIFYRYVEGWEGKHRRGGQGYFRLSRWEG